MTIPNKYVYYNTQLSTNLQGMKIGLLMEGFEGAEEDVAHIVKDATKQYVLPFCVVSNINYPPRQIKSPIE